MPRHKSNQDSLERRVIETPTLSRIDLGIVNEGFDSISSPSFFYVEDSTSWIDPRRNDHKRFTESWIELDRAYSCGSSVGGAKKCKDRCCCSCCCTFSCAKVGRIVAYLLVALSVIGFAAIISAILYMEIFHKFDYEWHPLKDTSVFSDHRHQANRTSISYLPPEEGPTVILPAAASASTSTSSTSKETIVSSTSEAPSETSNSSANLPNSTTSSASEPVATGNSVTSPSPSPSTASTSSSNIINSSTSISTTAGYTHKAVNVTIAPKRGTNAPVNVTSS